MDDRVDIGGCEKVISKVKKKLTSEKKMRREIIIDPSKNDHAEHFFLSFFNEYRFDTIASH